MVLYQIMTSSKTSDHIISITRYIKIRKKHGITQCGYNEKIVFNTS